MNQIKLSSISRCDFLKFIISVRCEHCHYSPRASLRHSIHAYRLHCYASSPSSLFSNMTRFKIQVHTCKADGTSVSDWHGTAGVAIVSGVTTWVGQGHLPSQNRGLRKFSCNNPAALGLHVWRPYPWWKTWRTSSRRNRWRGQKKDRISSDPVISHDPKFGLGYRKPH